jgi:rubrerythrin
MEGHMHVDIDKNGRITISDFSSLQAYKAAIKMEDQGIEFYAGLLKQVKAEDARHEIEFLIDQERSHRDVFQSLLDQEKESKDDAFEEDDIVDYLNSKIFDVSQAESAAREIDDHQTSLRQAMDMERRSIVFYEGCLAQAQGSSAREAFARIIGEEKKHLAKFAEFVRLKCIDSGKGCIL